MSELPEYYHVLAEAVSPLSHSLAAGLLIRPVSSSAGHVASATLEALHELCRDLDRMLKECVPAMRLAMSDLEGCALDSLEEIVDELASPALELVDMSRRIWETPLPPEAESARVLLGTLAEAPVTQLMQWVLESMHLAIDPWSLTENPDQPDLGFELQVPDAPIRDALARWREAHPGVLPEGIL